MPVDQQPGAVAAEIKGEARLFPGLQRSAVTGAVHLLQHACGIYHPKPPLEEAVDLQWFALHLEVHMTVVVRPYP